MKLGEVDRNVAVTKKTTLYNDGRKKSITECTSCQTFRLTSYNSSSQPGTKKKLILKWTMAHPNQTAEESNLMNLDFC